MFWLHLVETLEKSLKNQGVFKNITPHLNPGKQCQQFENTLENFSNSAQNGIGK